MYRAHIAKRHEPIHTTASLDQLVPENHLVRKIDRHVDFSIVHRLCAPLYSNTGQPGIDPEILIKIILLTTDSTHIRANASKKKFDKTEVDAVVTAVKDELLARVNEDQSAYGKKR